MKSPGMENSPYRWTPADKKRYILSMIPVAILMLGTLIVLTPICIYMSILWLMIYLVLNLFQAGCCVGCPYRGTYCPAFFGVYLGNWISSLVYTDEEFEKKKFRYYALWGELTLVLFLVYPLYWLFAAHWYFGVFYLLLIVLHIWIFLPTQCKKCSYNHTCPGGRSYHFLCRLMQLRKKQTQCTKPAV